MLQLDWIATKMVDATIYAAVKAMVAKDTTSTATTASTTSTTTATMILFLLLTNH